MENTTATGDQFRDAIAELLRTAGYDVVTEVLEGHKRADLTFSQSSFGKRRRFALEAKNWEKSLALQDLETIYGGYAALLQKGRIDQLLIVSRQPIKSSAAKAFIRDTYNVAHQTFVEFQESIMGFREYLVSTINSYEQDGLEKYYVPPRIEGSGSLDEFIDGWVVEGKQPIAVIAGYGMGKTSSARHTFYRYAVRYVADEPCRVPILISLGALSREQSLEGLISSSLSSNGRFVHNYNYGLFLKLNELGRFLILLDGFDEMKHLMSRSEFQANFLEINKLSCGNSRVILLGRPSAFLSEDERDVVLRGTRKIGSLKTKVIGSPIYRELSLAPFSSDQLVTFIQNYLAYLWEKSGVAQDRSFLRRRRAEIENDIDQTLISRPVHARMLAEIATDRSVDIRGISRFNLYSYFINHLIEREDDKESRRKAFGVDDRRRFACELAWFLWMDPRGAAQGCRIEELPESLFANYTLSERDDLMTIKRELLSGSFLEEKPGGLYYLPHRSFQEFLVAEHIWDHRLVEEFLLGPNNFLTGDVVLFIDEQVDSREFFDEVVSHLSSMTHRLSLDTLSALCASSAFLASSASRTLAEASAWDVMIYFVSLYCLHMGLGLADDTYDVQGPEGPNKSLPSVTNDYDNSNIFSSASTEVFYNFENYILNRFVPAWKGSPAIILELLYCISGFPIAYSKSLKFNLIFNLIVHNADFSKIEGYPGDHKNCFLKRMCSLRYFFDLSEFTLNRTEALV